MSEQNIAVVRRWFEEVWNQRRVEVIDELLTTESKCHADHGLMLGTHEFVAQMYRPLVGAFPDIRVKIEDAVEQGEMVVVRWKASGMHTGDGLGCPATNKPVELRGMTWLRVVGGKLVEGWQHSNLPDVLHELTASRQMPPKVLS